MLLALLATIAAAGIVYWQTGSALLAAGTVAVIGILLATAAGSAGSRQT